MGKPDRLMLACGCLHYSWVILAVATLGKVFTSPGQSPCIGVVVEDVRATVNITRTEMTGLYLGATTLSAAVLPLTGQAIDRAGPRAMVLVFSVGLACACFLMSTAQGGGLHLFLALFMLRFFGQGSMMNVSVYQINLWWIKRRGAMMGVAGAIVSSMMLGVIPVVMMALTGELGWRGTYVVLGVATLSIMTTLGGCFYRGKPEKYGMLPDARAVPSAATLNDDGGGDYGDREICVEMVAGMGGTNNHEKNNSDDSNDDEDENPAFEEVQLFGAADASSSDIASSSSSNNNINNNNNNALVSATAAVGALETNWQARDVFRSPTFWAFAFSDMIVAGTGTAFWFHLRSAFGEAGVGEVIINTIYPLLAVVSVGGRLLSGWFIDRAGCRRVMVVGLLLHAMGLALVPSMHLSDGIAFAVALLVGVSGSFTSNVRSTAYASLFGRKYLGQVQTVASSLTVFGSAIGPFPFGVARDNSGSWEAPFAAGSLFPLLGAVAVALWGNLKDTRRPATGRSGSGFSLVGNDDDDDDDGHHEQ